MCGFVCIELIDFMLKGKSLLEYTNLFSPNDYEKMIKNYIALFVVSIENLKNLKYHTS